MTTIYCNTLFTVHHLESFSAFFFPTPPVLALKFLCHRGEPWKCFCPLPSPIARMRRCNRAGYLQPGHHAVKNFQALSTHLRLPLTFPIGMRYWDRHVASDITNQILPIYFCTFTLVSEKQACGETLLCFFINSSLTSCLGLH